MFGQKRSKEIAALAAEQAVPKILCFFGGFAEKT